MQIICCNVSKPFQYYYLESMKKNFLFFPFFPFSRLSLELSTTQARTCERESEEWRVKRDQKTISVSSFGNCEILKLAAILEAVPNLNLFFFPFLSQTTNKGSVTFYTHIMRQWHWTIDNNSEQKENMGQLCKLEEDETIKFMDFLFLFFYHFDTNFAPFFFFF